MFDTDTDTLDTFTLPSKRLPRAGIKYLEEPSPTVKMPLCRLCINAWEQSNGRYHMSKGCSFCRRIAEVWSRMSPEEREQYYQPDSPSPMEVAICRQETTIIFKRSDKHLTSSKQLEDAIY